MLDIIDFGSKFPTRSACVQRSAITRASSSGAFIALQMFAVVGNSKESFCCHTKSCGSGSVGFRCAPRENWYFATPATALCRCRCYRVNQVNEHINQVNKHKSEIDLAKMNAKLISPSDRYLLSIALAVIRRCIQMSLNLRSSSNISP